tara:strand:+ start:445 stop:630 length:186 start_codon:yes stop_codon:yes gene_type:complete
MIFALFIFSTTHIFLFEKYENQQACWATAQQISTRIDERLPNRFIAECISIEQKNTDQPVS